MEIGDRIKQRRESLNMSQEELANKVGYKSRSSINKIELDGRGLPQSKIVAFAKALETTPAYLMGWEKEVDATISKELQISKEALYTINKFPLTIDKNTGHSLMDVFNAIVANDNFSKILHSILLYIARNETDWNKMVTHFSNDFKNADIKTMKSLCYTNIVREFEELLYEVLSSDISTFNRVSKTTNGGLVIGIRPENQYLYNLDAANQRIDIEVPEGADTSDDDIMDDDNF